MRNTHGFPRQSCKPPKGIQIVDNTPSPQEEMWAWIGIAVILGFILICVCALIFIPKAEAQLKPAYTDEEIVNAIYRAEGADKAIYKYGIRSIKYKDEAEARQICLNSVRNNKVRWEKAGRPHDFITFMGLRYCPPKAHPKNSNWVKNVKYFLLKLRKELKMPKTQKWKDPDALSDKNLLKTLTKAVSRWEKEKALKKRKSK